jgi:hypothetical protein
MAIRKAESKTHNAAGTLKRNRSSFTRDQFGRGAISFAQLLLKKHTSYLKMRQGKGRWALRASHSQLLD